MARYYPSGTKSDAGESMHPRLLFSCHPSDSGIYDNEIIGDISSVRDCLFEKPEPGIHTRAAGADAAWEVDAYVFAVTARFLREPNIACDEVLPAAVSGGVPILAFVEEKGVGAEFLEHVRRLSPDAVGRVRVIDKHYAAATDIPFIEALEFHLTSIADGEPAVFDEKTLLARAEEALSCREADGTPDSGAACAAAVIRAGDGLFECGAAQSAMDVYDKAVKFCRELVERHGTAEAKVELWRSLSRLGCREMTKNPDGDPLLWIPGILRIEEAHNLSKELLKAEPNDRMRELVAVSLRQLGAAKEATDFLDLAAELYKEGLRICAELSFRSPVEEDMRRRVAACYEKIGSDNTGYRHIPSWSAFGEAAEQYEKLIARRENAAVADRLRYALLCRRAGDSNMSAERAEAAAEFYKKSRETLLPLSKELADARVNLLLASVYDRECSIAFESGDMESAVIACIEANGLYGRNADRLGTEDVYRRHAASLLRFAAIRKEQKQFALAAKHCREVVELMREPSYGMRAPKSAKLLGQCREEYETLRRYLPQDEDADDPMHIDDDSYGDCLAQLEDYERQMMRSRRKTLDGSGRSLGNLIYECGVAVAIATNLELPDRARRVCDECMDFVAKIASERIENRLEAYAYIAERAYRLGEICARNCLDNHAAKLYSIARGLYEQIFAESGSEQDREALVTASISLGEALLASGQHAAAKDDYRRALELLRSHRGEEDTGAICRAYEGLAMLHSELGSMMLARKYAERSYAEAKAYVEKEYCGETVSVLMESRLVLSRVCMAEGNYADAHRYLDEIDYEYGRFMTYHAEACAEGDFLARYNMCLAELARAEGNTELAILHCDTAVDEAYELIFDEFDFSDYVTIARAHSLLGCCLAEAGETERARCNLNRAGVFGERFVKSAECVEAVVAVGEAYLAMSKLYESAEKPFDAMRYCLKAIRVCDTLPKQMRTRAVIDTAARSRLRLAQLEK